MSDINWSTETIRAILTVPDCKEKENCYVCGKHKTIAQLHHIVPVNQIAKLLNLGVIELCEASTPVVWLCPNHHAYIHELMNGNCSLITNCEFEPNEVEKLCDILKLYDNHIKKLAENNAQRPQTTQAV